MTDRNLNAKRAARAAQMIVSKWNQDEIVKHDDFEKLIGVRRKKECGCGNPEYYSVSRAVKTVIKRQYHQFTATVTKKGFRLCTPNEAPDICEGIAIRGCHVTERAYDDMQYIPDHVRNKSNIRERLARIAKLYQQNKQYVDNMR